MINHPWYSLLKDGHLGRGLAILQMENWQYLRAFIFYNILFVKIVQPLIFFIDLKV